MIANLIKSILRIRNVSLFIVVLFVEMWIYINAEQFFGAEYLGYQAVIGAYLIIFGVFFAVPDLKLLLFHKPFFKVLPRYIMFFVITTAVLNLAGGLLVNDQYYGFLVLSGVSLGILLIHSLIVAVVEEGIFRGVLGNRLGWFWSSIAFAVTHYVVYDANLFLMGWAFIMGIIFFVLMKKYGLESSIAVHGAYNVFVLGITAI